MVLRAETLVALLFLTAGCRTTDSVQPASTPTIAPAQPTPTATIAPPVVEPDPPAGTDCSGSLVRRGGQNLLELADGSIATLAPMAVNVDGSGRAYHRDGFAGGAIIHLCNAGQVHLPDGTRYHGSESNETCSGRFLDDVAAIGEAGWMDPEVGAVRWYGILGLDEALVAGRRVRGVRPVEVADGSGFYVSPTTLEDRAFEVTDQRRYLDALSIPHAVVHANSGVPMGALGVAWRVRGCHPDRVCPPIPFIVADRGPRIGEGSLRLTRLVNGLDPDATITRRNRFAGVVGNADILYVFFPGERMEPPYDAARVASQSVEAFLRWGGPIRLQACLDSNVPNANE